MPKSRLRLIVDTNVIVRGVVNLNSPAGKIVRAIEQRSAVVLLSKRVLAEYRAVLTDPAFAERFPDLTAQRIDVALRRFRYFGHYLPVVRARFDFARDPRDAMFIELAISGNATDIVTSDKDLLSLRSGRSDASKRFRQRARSVRIGTAAEFLQANPELDD